MKREMKQSPDQRIQFLENLEAEFAKAGDVKKVADTLTAAGFEPYLVGGCLRDLLLGREPKDWDIATDATPEEIQEVFPDSVYENAFGTVAVKTMSEDPRMKIVEVTTFRTESEYTDKRHPDKVAFAKTIEEDLARRDFTINAMAFEVSSHKRRAEGLVDPHGGLEDLERKVIRAVGKAEDRFEEDALRIMRAVRFSAQLGFGIEEETAAAMKKKSNLLERIAKERIRDELEKLLMADDTGSAVRRMQELGILRHAIPELEEGVGVGQNKHHIYTVFEHNVRALEYAASKKFPLDLRLASLLHDIGKPKTKHGNGPNSTFYGHQVVGERMAQKLLARLHFPKELTDRVALLIREHMFVYDLEVTTLRGVRRLLSRVGKENIDDLFRLREADRIGSGVPKAQPYRLRHLKAMVEKVQKDPISAKMLKVNGTDIMKMLEIQPGPRVGAILAILLEDVLDEPSRNTKEKLTKRINELHKLSDGELRALIEKAKEVARRAQEKIDEAIKRKHFVE